MPRQNSIHPVSISHQTNTTSQYSDKKDKEVSFRRIWLQSSKLTGCAPPPRPFFTEAAYNRLIPLTMIQKHLTAYFNAAFKPVKIGSLVWVGDQWGGGYPTKSP